MHPDIFMLFEKAPAALPLYEEFERRILLAFKGVRLKVGKTQVSFYNTHGFAWAWPPLRRKKDWPKVFLGVTFGLPSQLEHPRIAQAVQPYPHRWTHHVLVQNAADLDAQLMGWIEESYRFSLSKR